MARASRSVPAFVAVAVLAAAGLRAEEPTYTRYIDTESDRVPAQTVVPEYPRIARRDRIEGAVQICYHVDRKGRPYRVAVRNSTHRVFERAAMRAIKASTYRPLKAGEAPAGIKSCRTFRFELTPTTAINGQQR